MPGAVAVADPLYGYSKNNQTAQAGVAASTNKPGKRLACTHTELASSPRKIALALASNDQESSHGLNAPIRTARPLLTVSSSGALQVDECSCSNLTHMCVTVFECDVLQRDGGIGVARQPISMARRSRRCIMESERFNIEIQLMPVIFVASSSQPGTGPPGISFDAIHPGTRQRGGNRLITRVDRYASSRMVG